MKCFWDNNGTCKHPKIGRTPAFEARCSACSMRRFVPLNLPDMKDKEHLAKFEQARQERRTQELDAVKKAAPGFVSKALSWAKAEISRVVKGPVPADQYRDRLEICNGCQNLKRATEAGKLGWCTACGCGERGRAELTIKATMPEAKCPTGAWDNLASKRVPLPEPKG